jgi:hypothetical protein
MLARPGQEREGVAVGKFWVGAAQTIFNYKSSSDLSDGQIFVSFDSPVYQDGDTILRLLLGYYLISQQATDADLAHPFIAFPTAAAAWFYPNPNFPDEINSASVEDATTGDALFTDLLRYKETRWTDGTDHGSIFMADSGGTVSVQAERTINDKTVDTLTYGLGTIGGDADLPLFEPGFYGRLWMKWLVLRH